MTRAGKIAKTVLGSAAIAAMPTTAALALPVPETENNDTFPGQTATVATTYSGELCLDSPSTCTGFFQVAGQDLTDFYHYTGLPAGGSFDLSFDNTTGCCGNDLVAGRYDSAGPPSASVSTDSALVHLTGTIPGSGELTFGITGEGFGLETYLVTLNVTPPQVAAPPALALLTAGLGALSIEVARRRKRVQ